MLQVVDLHSELDFSYRGQKREVMKEKQFLVGVSVLDSK